MDHSAFDAYAFKIEADDRKVFHTGDFRTHGFRSKTLPSVIEKYIGKVDCVVSEGTNIERSKDAVTKSEQVIKKEFTEGFKENKYNVVYVSSTNIDRLFTLYHAACTAGRMFILDEFANVGKIPDLDIQITLIRSAGMFCSIIVQAPSQLEAIYGVSLASTIFLEGSKHQRSYGRMG